MLFYQSFHCAGLQRPSVLAKIAASTALTRPAFDYLLFLCLPKLGSLSQIRNCEGLNDAAEREQSREQIDENTPVLKRANAHQPKQAGNRIYARFLPGFSKICLPVPI